MDESRKMTRAAHDLRIQAGQLFSEGEVERAAFVAQHAQYVLTTALVEETRAARERLDEIRDGIKRTNDLLADPNGDYGVGFYSQGLVAKLDELIRRMP